MGNLLSKIGRSSSKEKKPEDELPVDNIIKIGEHFVRDELKKGHDERVTPPTSRELNAIVFGNQIKRRYKGAKVTIKDPFAYAYWNCIEQYCARTFAGENVEFVKEMIKLKDLYIKDPKDIESLQAQMQSVYVNLIINEKSHINIHDSQRSLFTGKQYVTPKQTEPLEPQKKTDDKPSMADILGKETEPYDWVKNKWMKEGKICDPRGDPWKASEVVIIQTLTLHLGGKQFEDSKEFEEWKRNYSAMFNSYLKSRQDKSGDYTQAVEEWKSAPENRADVEQWKTANGLEIKASHQHYQNMIMDFEKDLEPYYYRRHNDDISQAYDDYDRSVDDYSHVSVPLLSGESEVMLSRLAMVVIFIAGIVICFFCWVWCALVGYFFISMRKSGERKRKKKQYERVEEEEENDIEREYESN